MKYFISVVNFVDQHILWVVALFLLASILELIIFLHKKSGGKFDTEGFFVCIVTNLTIIIGLYILACLGVGLVNCIKDQDYHFWANYLTFLGNGGHIILWVVFIGATIWLISQDGDGWLAAILGGALAAGAAFLAGFLIYIVVAILIIILKVLWFVVSGFFLSIFEFVVKYWQMSTAVLVGPGLIYGVCCAFVNYIKSFKNEVVHQ